MAGRAKRRRRLWDAYCFPGFRPQPTVCGVFGDPIARVIRLTRRSKKRLVAVAGASRWAGTNARCGVGAACSFGASRFFLDWGGGGFAVAGAATGRGGGLALLRDKRPSPKRFAIY